MNIGRAVFRISDFVSCFKSSLNPLFLGNFCRVINTLGKCSTGYNLWKLTFPKSKQTTRQKNHVLRNTSLASLPGFQQIMPDNLEFSFLWENIFQYFGKSLLWKQLIFGCY